MASQYLGNHRQALSLSSSSAVLLRSLLRAGSPEMLDEKRGSGGGDAMRTSGRGGWGGGGGGTRAASTSPVGFGNGGRSLGNLKLMSRRHRHSASMSSMAAARTASSSSGSSGGGSVNGGGGRFGLQDTARLPMPAIYRPKTANLARFRPPLGTDTDGGGGGGGGNDDEDRKPFQRLLAPTTTLTPRSLDKLVRVQSKVRAHAVARKLPQLMHAHRRGEQRRNKARAHMRRAAVEIQKTYRGHHTWLNRHRIVELRAQAAAATEIQRHVRGRLVVREAERAGQKLAVGLWVQARYRGEQGRVLYEHLLEEHRKEEYARLQAEQAAMAATLERAEAARRARLAAEREEARRQREAEEERHKEAERKEFLRKKAAERERQRREAAAAEAERRRLAAAEAAAEAARLAALEAERRQLEALGFQQDCARARELQEKMKEAIARESFPAAELRETLEQYVKIRVDAAPHVEVFTNVIARLLRMEELTRLVATLKNSDISEIKSFAKPPTSVVVILRCVYTMLGEPAKSTATWPGLCKLLGQKSKGRKVQDRIRDFQPNSVTATLVRDVEGKVAKFGASKADIDKINKCVSLLYAWLQGTIDMIQTIAILRTIE